MVGRREHAPVIQQIINEMAYDHEQQFPDCRHCQVLRGTMSEEKPSEPEDLIVPPPV